MRYLKITLWVLIFVVTAILFNLQFTMLYTPAGMMGEATYSNTVASGAYLACWFILAVIAGFKGYESILTAALVYSMLPVLGYISGYLFAGTKLMVLFLFIYFWAVPTQGLCFGNEKLILLMMALQPFIFWMGYHLHKLRKDFNA